MRFLHTRRSAVAVLAAVAAAVPMGVTTAGAAQASDDSSEGTARTSALEARRVDRVTVTFDWGSCGLPPEVSTAECSFVRLPLDYDDPTGPTVKVEVARVRAAKPGMRLGTIFVNPGGPSAPATDLAIQAPEFLDQRILDRFDIVGVDPRGVGFGDNVRCFRTFADQVAASEGTVAIPLGRAQEKASIAASRTFAAGCATTGQPLAGSMSTAEVARDMDVVRRALGEKKLNFLGFSYGSQLGQVYANMFPDRFRTLVIDGVIDPVAWTTGRGDTGRRIPVDDRLRSADGSYLALTQYLARCDKAGAPACAFAAADGDSLAKWDLLVQRVKAAPIVVQDPDLGTFTFDYSALVGGMLQALYGLGQPDVPALLAQQLEDVFQLSEPGLSPARKAALAKRAGASRAALRDAVVPPRARAVDEPYFNSTDAFLAVTCSDSVNPARPERWISAGAAADRRAPYFGRAWIWSSNPCASSIWKARDEDRYLGPFDRRTAAPVLVIGNFYDPATSYRDGAVPSARTLGNARLLTSDSWGHTAYGTSDCVNDAVAAYFLSGRLPAKGTVCVGAQPFEQTAAAASARSSQGMRTSGRPAPIRPFVPGQDG